MPDNPEIRLVIRKLIIKRYTFERIFKEIEPDHKNYSEWRVKKWINDIILRGDTKDTPKQFCPTLMAIQQELDRMHCFETEKRCPNPNCKSLLMTPRYALHIGDGRYGSLNWPKLYDNLHGRMLSLSINSHGQRIPSFKHKFQLAAIDPTHFLIIYPHRSHSYDTFTCYLFKLDVLNTSFTLLDHIQLTGSYKHFIRDQKDQNRFHILAFLENGYHLHKGQLKNDELCFEEETIKLDFETDVILESFKLADNKLFGLSTKTSTNKRSLIYTEWNLNDKMQFCCNRLFEFELINNWNDLRIDQVVYMLRWNCHFAWSDSICYVATRGGGSSQDSFCLFKFNVKTQKLEQLMECGGRLFCDAIIHNGHLHIFEWTRSERQHGMFCPTRRPEKLDTLFNLTADCVRNYTDFMDENQIRNFVLQFPPNFHF